MQLVVLIAVSAAVKTDIASWITDFQKSLYFITLFLLNLRAIASVTATRVATRISASVVARVGAG